jgi:hypothetical protein
MRRVEEDTLEGGEKESQFRGREKEKTEGKRRTMRQPETTPTTGTVRTHPEKIQAMARQL